MYIIVVLCCLYSCTTKAVTYSVNCISTYFKLISILLTHTIIQQGDDDYVVFLFDKDIWQNKALPVKDQLQHCHVSFSP